MGSVPLPALDIRTQQVNPLDEFARIFQIRGLQGQQQLQQGQIQEQNLALADDQKWRSAMSRPDWDGSPEQLLKNGLKAGVGPQSYAHVAQSLASLGEATAKFGSEQLKTQQALNDHIGNQLQAVDDAPDENKLAAQQQAKANAISWITSTPGIHPVVRQQMLQGIQKIPDDSYIGDDAIEGLIGQNKLHSALAEEGLKTAQTGEAAGKGAQAQAEAAQIAGKSNPQSPLYSPTPQALALGASQGNTQAQAIQGGMAQQKGAEARAEAAGKLPSETALEKLRQSGENYRAGLARQTQFANELQKNGLTQLDKMFTDPQHGYTQFLSQAQATKDTVGRARNGDELASSLVPLMTALGVTSFAGVHRINQTEVNAAGPGVGSAFRRVNSILDKVGSGTVPADTLNEMDNLVDGLIDARHQATVKGAQMVAANAGLDPQRTIVMGRDGSISTLGSVVARTGGGQGGGSNGPEPGYTRIQASDGSMHDIPSQNMNAARRRDPGLQVVQ
jgi:hypothetical protein